MTSIRSGNSNSQERTWSQSTYPKPPPLSERSASQKNVQTLRNLHPDFGKTLFTKWPRSSPSKMHVFEDEVEHAPENEAKIHAGPLFRQQHSPISVKSHVLRGQENEGVSYNPPSNVQSSMATSIPTYPEAAFPELPPLSVVANNLRQSTDISTERPESAVSKANRHSYSIFPSSGSKTPRISLASTIGRVRSQSTTSTASYGLFPHLPTDFAATIAAATSALERPRSSSSPQERPRSASSPVAPTEDMFQNTLARIPLNTTTSVSDNANENIASTISRESSERSPGVGMSTGRAVYSNPQSIHRKNVAQSFSDGALRNGPQSRSSSVATEQMQPRIDRPRMNSNFSGFSGRQGAVSPVFEEHHSRKEPQSRNGFDPRDRSSSRNGHQSRHSPSPHGGRLSPRPGYNNARHASNGRVSPRPAYNSRHVSNSRNASSSRTGSSSRSRVPSNGFGPRNGSFARNQFNPNHDMDYSEYPEEFGEAVPQMNFMPSSKAANLESRPSTSSSHQSGRGSLYKFLNDSYTSWAKVYYQNEGTLRLEMPPNVTSTNTPPQSRSVSRNPSGATQMLQVPNGMRHPDQQYIQRLPPVQNYPRGKFVPRNLSQTTIASSIPEEYRPARGPPPAKHFRPPQTADSFASIDSRFSNSTAASGVPTILRAPRGPPRLMSEQLPATPEDHSEARYNPNMSGMDSPTSAGFPETVYVPRIRPMQHPAPNTPDSVMGQMEEDQADNLEVPVTPSPQQSVQINPDVSRFSDDHRSSDQDPVWREQSAYKEDKGMFGIVNRQVVLFCVGFVFPFAWFIAAFLRIPSRPEMRMLGREEYSDTAPAGVDLFDSMAVVRYQKARRWRMTNRIMSVLGILILIIIGVCAGVATR